MTELPEIANEAMCAIVEAAIPEPCRRWFGALLAEARNAAGVHNEAQFETVCSARDRYRSERDNLAANLRTVREDRDTALADLEAAQEALESVRREYRTLSIATGTPHQSADAAAMPPVVTADAPVTVETANDTNAASGQSVRGCDVCVCGHSEYLHDPFTDVCGERCECRKFSRDPEAGK